MVDDIFSVTRRALLASLAALPVAAAAQIAVAEASVDAKLLALAPRFDELLRRAVEIGPSYRAAMKAEAAIKDHGAPNAVGEHVGGAVVRQAGEAEALQAERGFCKLDAIAHEAIELGPAQTLKGAAFQARLTFYANTRLWTKPEEHLEGDDLCLRNTIDAICALAGVDRLGRPLRQPIVT
ncbi:hypothetical protein [Microvirga massiliensis]|uniref:hypothetical protein n=1 Tax=Microvirga massiliensis TaxID=1033741 RepID=UPI00062B5B66|nr:hypothetical protein [Microvirga massiliensis]